MLVVVKTYQFYEFYVLILMDCRSQHHHNKEKSAMVVDDNGRSSEILSRIVCFITVVE